MPNIDVTITDRVAKTQGAPCIVCGNSDYTITFAFDTEWEEYKTKTARFVYVADGRMRYQEVIFAGNVCAVPVLAGVVEVFAGVYAGDLRTTTPARIPCQHSILCGDPIHADPAPDVYLQLLEMLAAIQAGQKVTILGVLEPAGALTSGAVLGAAKNQRVGETGTVWGALNMEEE